MESRTSHNGKTFLMFAASMDSVLNTFQGEVRVNEPMWKHVSFRIGGKADALVIPHDIEDLKGLIMHASEAEIPLIVIGGTNLLVRDGGIEGIVVSLHRFQEIQHEGASRLYVGGGVRMPHLLNVASRHGYGGLEFASGIPGTVAGSVVMNAGTARGEMQDVVHAIHLLDKEGKLHVIQSEALEFGYRRSFFPPGIVVGVWINVTLSPVKHIAMSIKAALRKRKQTQPLSLPSAGCVFRNPRGDSAGRLIENAGFKGYRVGDAAMSTVHANFAVNVGCATARDVLTLIDQVRTGVNRKTGVVLDLELIVVGREQS